MDMVYFRDNPTERALARFHIASARTPKNSRAGTMFIYDNPTVNKQYTILCIWAFVGDFVFFFFFLVERAMIVSALRRAQSHIGSAACDPQLYRTLYNIQNQQPHNAYRMHIHVCTL